MLGYQPRSRRRGPGLKKFMWRGWQSHKKTSQRQNWRQKLGDNDEREHGFLENIFTKIPLLLGNCPKSHFPGNLELEGVGRMDTLHRSSPIRRVERPPGLRMVGLYPGSVQSQEASVSSLFVSTGFHWVGQEIHSDFSVRSYGQTWMNFLTNQQEIIVAYGVSHDSRPLPTLFWNNWGWSSKSRAV